MNNSSQRVRSHRVYKYSHITLMNYCITTAKYRGQCDIIRVQPLYYNIILFVLFILLSDLIIINYNLLYRYSDQVLN